MAITHSESRSKKGVFFALSLLLVCGLGVMVYFVSQNKSGSVFDTRNRASSSTGGVVITLENASGTRYVGDTFPVKIMLKTGGNKISGLGVRLQYSFTNATPELEVVGGQVNLTLPSGLVRNVNTVFVDTTGKKVYIDFGAISESVDGFSLANAEETVQIGTIMMKAKAAKTVTIESDPTKSQATSKNATLTTTGGADNLDILQNIAPITIGMQADTLAPTVAITAGPEAASTDLDGSVTFTWQGTDAPSRPNDAAPTLEYGYAFDSAAAGTLTPTTTITKQLEHGAHTFYVKARDPMGSNTWSPVVSRTFNVDLTPFITSVTPASGYGPGQTYPATQITIEGRNFGATKGQISFGKQSATAVRWYSSANEIVSWSDTKIVAKTAYTEIPDGKLVVYSVKSTKVHLSNAVDFNLQHRAIVYFPIQGLKTDGTQVLNPPLLARAVIKKGTTFSQAFDNLEVKWDAAKKLYKVEIGPISKTNFVNAATDYTISIKVGSRLREKFVVKEGLKFGYSMDIMKADTLTTPVPTMFAADFQPDGVLSLLDYGLLIRQISSSTINGTPVTDATRMYDLNRDNMISLTDISILLSSYKQLVTTEDAE